MVQGYFLPVGGVTPEAASSSSVMAAAVVLAMKGKATRRREKGVDDASGERVPEQGAEDCLREGILQRKIKNTRSLEEMSQTRLMVLSKDKLFFCKESDRQHVYDHIPLSEIADVEALSADSFVRDCRRRGTLRRHQSLMHGHTHESLGGSFVTDTAVASSPNGGSKPLLREDSWLDSLANKNLQSGYVRTVTSATTVNVSVQQGRGLKATDWNGSSDPYVVLRLASAPETSKTQTDVVSKNVNPIWEETLDLTSLHIDSESVLVSVFDKDVLSDDFIGSVAVPLCDLIDSQSAAATPGSIKDTRTLGTRLGGSEPRWYQLLDEAHQPAGEVQLGFELTVAELEDKDAAEFCFSIRTDPQGFNFGRMYTQKCVDRKDAAAWVDVIRKAVKDAKSRKEARDLMRAHGHSKFAMLRDRAKSLERESNTYQFFLAATILTAFAVDIGEAQLPDVSATTKTLFETGNSVLAVIFLAQLLVVLVARSEHNFESMSAGLLIDCFIVVVCIVQAILQYIDSDMPSLKVFRMLRVIRVLRIFHEFRSLRRLIMRMHALSACPSTHSGRVRSCKSGACQCQSVHSRVGVVTQVNHGPPARCTAGGQRPVHPAHLHEHVRIHWHPRVSGKGSRVFRHLHHVTLYPCPVPVWRQLGVVSYPLNFLAAGPKQ